MTDKGQIIQLYKEMYTAMVNKDRTALERVRMTGMRQSRQEYINAIMDGTLNYYSAEHQGMQAEVKGENAALVGKSRVTAAVFGGGKHTWRFQLVKKTANDILR